VLGEPAVQNLVDLIQNKIQEIETRYECRREVDVARDGQVHVVFGADGISSGQDGRARIEGGNDARFCDGYRLLLLSPALACGERIKDGVP
jgi:hypothetical protein